MKSPFFRELWLGDVNTLSSVIKLAKGGEANSEFRSGLHALHHPTETLNFFFFAFLLFPLGIPSHYYFIIFLPTTLDSFPFHLFLIVNKWRGLPFHLASDMPSHLGLFLVI